MLAPIYNWKILEFLNKNAECFKIMYRLPTLGSVSYVLLPVADFRHLIIVFRDFGLQNKSIECIKGWELRLVNLFMNINIIIILTARVGNIGIVNRENHCRPRLTVYLRGMKISTQNKSLHFVFRIFKYSDDAGQNLRGTVRALILHSF